METLGLTERICQLAERESEVKKEEVNTVDALSNLGDDIYLDYGKKIDESMYCLVCDTADSIPVGENVYTFCGAIVKDGTEESFEPIVLCPKHLSEMAEQILLHIVRVSKGKEKGAIHLPLRKWEEDDKGVTE